MAFLFQLFILSYSINAAENCGMLFNSVFEFDQKNIKGKITEFYPKDEVFCDLGKKELSANIEIKLFGQNKKQFDSKKIFIQPTTMSEKVQFEDALKKISLTNTALLNVYRTVQFEIPKKHSKKFSYKIIYINKDEIIGEGEYVEKK